MFDPGGNLVANSGQTHTNSEVATIPSAVGSYTVRVVYYTTTNASYNGKAEVDAPATNVSQTAPAGTPT